MERASHVRGVHQVWFKYPESPVPLKRSRPNCPGSTAYPQLTGGDEYVAGGVPARWASKLAAPPFRVSDPRSQDDDCRFLS